MAFEDHIFPTAPQKGSRFKVGVQSPGGKVVAFSAFLTVENARETQNCRHFLDFALQECLSSQGSGVSRSRNAEQL